MDEMLQDASEAVYPDIMPHWGFFSRREIPLIQSMTGSGDSSHSVKCGQLNASAGTVPFDALTIRIPKRQLIDEGERFDGVLIVPGALLGFRMGNQPRLEFDALKGRILAPPGRKAGVSAARLRQEGSSTPKTENPGAVWQKSRG